MNVLLIQCDGKMPNLALMRIAAHHRDQGDFVQLCSTQNKGQLSIWLTTLERCRERK